MDKTLKNPIVTELIPRNGRKSFGGKAKIVESNGVKYLVSYSTLVCGVDSHGVVRRYSDWRSRTTSCHVKSFLGSVGSGMTSDAFWTLDCEPTPDVGVNFV